MGLFKSTMYATKNLPDPYARRRALPLGILAGGASILFVPESSRMPLTLFFFVRALEIAVRYQVIRNRLPAFEHADTLLMMAASAQVLHSWIFNVKSLDRSYENFLNHHGGRDPRLKHAVGTLNSAPFTLNVAEVTAAFKKIGLPYPNPVKYDECCQIIHPLTPSCLLGTFQFWVSAYKRALPVYIPVFVIPTLLFSGKKLLVSPRVPLEKTTIGILRSSLFLSMYCTNAWASICMCRNLGVRGKFLATVAGFAGGSAVLIEKKSRRLELALFVFSQALVSAWGELSDLHLVRPIPHAAVLMFALTAGSVLQSYSALPEAIRPTYLSLLKSAMGSV
eukprot:TRINITY_DN7705_c0_g1_i1.p1 TRINITY_DN7705_c0_g1~~TRINITY_DN7705_c0_g1_i1.p1  ORF type:complete len:336 (+),score=47.59 TRINITY_DN7705_c0_g1_i1:288-1295(+)